MMDLESPTPWLIVLRRDPRPLESTALWIWARLCLLSRGEKDREASGSKSRPFENQDKRAMRFCLFHSVRVMALSSCVSMKGVGSSETASWKADDDVVRVKRRASPGGGGWGGGAPPLALRPPARPPLPPLRPPPRRPLPPLLPALPPMVTKGRSGLGWVRLVSFF